MMKMKLVACEQDGFPILRINGHQQCLGEFTDHCLGRIKITDVVLRAGTMYYVFEDGHQLPLLCFCCGKPLASHDALGEADRMRGRKLKTYGWDTVEVEGGRTVIDFQLEFTRKFWELKSIWVHLSVHSVDKLIHPRACCQYDRNSPACSSSSAHKKTG